MKFAIYDNGVFTGVEREFDEKPVLVGKPWRSFYSVETVMPDYSPATHLRSGPVVEEDHQAEIRRYVWSVRDKTAEEADAEKNAKAAAVDTLIFRVLFNHENRIRTLEAKQPITAEQFRNALKAML
jgi:hypothetical protein